MVNENVVLILLLSGCVECLECLEGGCGDGNTAGGDGGRGRGGGHDGDGGGGGGGDDDDNDDGDENNNSVNRPGIQFSSLSFQSAAGLAVLNPDVSGRC